ncbi:hypothetical protein [Paracidovorax cattleyae]|uniref:Uncharacterized protein n=1 Tax=Paracidovorax cattleyae TaxID=80868 RepID=A0A1H0W752_9BURK|nr:hypothetical protein [Paracidovorax cattleyae]MBF9266190.1 hypothetical protein [Paracidovorax cattleyae]SDP86393.1 hypothetical protein SAMN04489708_13337 [Paracidovorax cattleyae]
MNDHESTAPGEPSQPTDRKAWTTPVVSFLSMDDTALNATVGDDGRGPTTGS